MSKIDIMYKMEKMVENIKEMKTIINDMYDMESMILKLSFEKSYTEKEILRFSLSNDYRNTYRNNGLITLIHKVYNISEIENFNENEIIIGFFNIQKELKEIDLKYEISDNRKEND